MKINLCLMALPLALMLGCGGDGITITAGKAKLDGHKLTVEHGEFTQLIYTSMQKDKTSKAATMIRVYLSDGPITKGKPADDKTMLYFSIAGPAGEKGPLPTGSYKGLTNGFGKNNFQMTHDVEITPAKSSGGEFVEIDSELVGAVELTTSSEEAVAGTIDIKKGDVHVQGAFAAKKQKR